MRILWKCCPQYASKFGKRSSPHRTGKGQFSFQSQRKAMLKNAQTTAQLHSSHMLVSDAQNSPTQASTVGEPWTSRYSWWFSKMQRNERSNCQHAVGSLKKQESSIKTSALLTMPKTVTMWTTTNCGKFFKSWEYQTTWPDSWKICMQVRRQQLELDMEQQTGSKSGKEYIKAVYCHPAYLTYMQSTSWETLGWRKNKLE